MKLFTQSQIAKQTALFLIPVMILTQAVPVSFAQGELISAVGTEENLPVVPVSLVDSGEKEADTPAADPTSAWLADSPLEVPEVVEEKTQVDELTVVDGGADKINWSASPDKDTAINHLVSHYGFSHEELNKWIKEGLLQITYLLARGTDSEIKNGGILFTFDESIQGQLRGADIDPLDPGFRIPKEMYFTDGIHRIYELPRFTKVVLSYSDARFGYDTIEHRYLKGLKNNSQFQYFKNGKEVKRVEVLTEGSPCRGMICPMVYMFPFKRVVVTYPEADINEISRREINYRHPFGIERQIPDVEYQESQNVPDYGIKSIIEYVRDANGSESVASKNNFYYDILASPCSINEDGTTGNCAVAHTLSKIVRMDENGKSRSTIEFLNSNGYETRDWREGLFRARITLVNGVTHEFFYQNQEELLNLARKFEIDDELHTLSTRFEAAATLLSRLAGGETFTLQDADEIRSVQAKLKLGIESLPENLREAWIKKFNEYLNQSDAIIATKALKVILDGGREIIVRNPTDLMTAIIRRFKMMEQTGKIDLSRLAGIDPEDLAGLESFKDYLSSRRIGAALSIPLFDLFSPYGNLELIDRLVRKYAEGSIARVEGPVEVVVEDFLRYVDGTKPVFDAAMEIARKIFASHPVQMPPDPMTLKSFQAVLEQMALLNHELSKELMAQIEQFRGEAVFKNNLINQITSAVMWNSQMPQSYGQIWQNLTYAINNRGIVYTINGKEVRVTWAELNSFTNGLPYDSANLFRYPGVKAEIDPSFLGGLISQDYYNRLGSINLQNASEFSMFSNPDSGNVYFSYPAKRFQLLEQFLKTWAEVINADGTVNFDRLRFRLLISYELEQALGRAEEYLNGKVKEMEAFANKEAFSSADYAAMKALLETVKNEMTARFTPLLKDVIYDTANEVTSRVQQRYQLLVNAFSAVLGKVNISVTLPDGTVVSINPRDLNAQVLEKILNSTAIRASNGLFTRGAYDRLNGIDETLLASLLSPETLNNLKAINLNNYRSFWQSQHLAAEEILFNLIPALIQKAGTADAEKLTAYLTEGIKLPVPLGQGLEEGVRSIIQNLSQQALDAVSGQSLNTIDDLLALREIFKKYHKDLSAQLEVFRDFLSPEDRSRVKDMVVSLYWRRYYSDPNLNLRIVLDQFNVRVNSIQFLEVEGVRVPVSQILQIPGFPWSRDFDGQLFPGLISGDTASAETQSEERLYQYFSFDLSSTWNTNSLSNLGRIEVVANIVRRLIESGAGVDKIFFVNAAGKREVDPEALRKHIKGVYAMQQAMIDETKRIAQAAAAELEQMKKEAYSIEEIEAMHRKVLEIRAKLISLLNENASRHERRDVIEVENAISLIYQKEVFDLFVSIVGAVNLKVEIDGQFVTVPAKAITEALIAYLKTQIDDSIAAHHFATLYGISVEHVRNAHKLENYLGEQMVVLPRNSEFVQIVSQLSELGYMQLATALVKRYAKDAIKNGTVDVALLIELVTNKDRAVTQIKQDAKDVLAGKIKELQDAAGNAISFEALTKMVSLMEDAKGRWVSMMNDFLSGNSDEALLKDLQDFVNSLYGELKAHRDGILEKTPFVYEVDGKKISIFLNKETLALFSQAVAEWLAANPGVKQPYPIEPIYPYPIDETIYETILFATKATAMVSDTLVEEIAMPVYYEQPVYKKRPIGGIWLPNPNPANYNPADHPTEFGLAVLLARLAVKYAEFAVDENGFNMDLFLKELQATAESRAERRLQILFDREYPALKDFIQSLRDPNGAMPVETIGKINERFVALKGKVSGLAQDAQNKAQEVWGKFMALYETSLFEGKLSVEINGKRITFEPKVLNDILMKLNREGKLSPELMAKFNEKIQNGESTWQYDSFKNLPYYRKWIDYGRGYITSSIEIIEDEKMDPLAQEGRFTLGDLSRIPGISSKDLNGLDVVEKDGRLRLSPVDPVTLLGMLDMRALAPGSGVNVGGLMRASSMSVMADTTMLVSEVDELVRIDEYGNVMTKTTPDLQWKSFRFVAFELIPAMLKEIISVLGEDSVVIDDQVSAEKFAQILGNNTEIVREAKVRAMIFADLVETFGLPESMLKDLLEKKLIKIDINLAKQTVLVSIDPEVTLSQGAGYVSLATLLEDHSLPAQITYQLGSKSMVVGTEGNPRCTFWDLGVCMNYDFNIYAKIDNQLISAAFTLKEHSYSVQYAGSHNNKIVQVDVLNQNSELIKRVTVNSHYFPGSSNYVGNVVRVHIGYFGSDHGEVDFRHVEILRLETGKYQYRSITDYIDGSRISGGDNTLAINEFEYSEDGMLQRIVCTNKDGNPLSTIEFLDRYNYKTRNWREGLFRARITLADGSINEFFYETQEELLNRAREFESQKQDPQIKEVEALLDRILQFSFGMMRDKVLSLMEQGLIKYQVDLKNMQASIWIDSSVVRDDISEDAANLTDLLGSRELPESISIKLGRGLESLRPCAISHDGLLIDCPPPAPLHLVSAEFQVKGNDANGDKELYFILDYLDTYRQQMSEMPVLADRGGDNLLHGVRIFEGNPHIVCITTPCPTGRLIKGISYSYDGYTLVSAIIDYLNPGKEEPASRVVTFQQLGQSSAESDYWARRGNYIHTIEDYRVGAMVSKTEFKYDVTDLLCPAGFGLPLGPCVGGDVKLAEMVRTDALGKHLSTIQLTDVDKPEPGFWEGEGNNFAIIQLPNGRMKHVRFASFEDLLNQAREFESEKDPQIKQVLGLVQGDLVNTFGMDAGQVGHAIAKGLIQVTVDLNLGTVLVNLEKLLADSDQLIRNEFLANLLGKPELPKEIRYNVMQGLQALASCSVSIDGGISGCPPPAPYFLVSGEYRIEENGITKTFVELNYRPVIVTDRGIGIRDWMNGDNRLQSVKVYDGDPRIVCITTPCPTGQLVKEVVYRWFEPCRGEMCIMGMWQDSAEVTYYGRKDLARRTVTFNSGGWISGDAPAGAIVTAQDFDHEDKLIAYNIFQYSGLIIADCAPIEGVDCSKTVIAGGKLEKIIRMDANGKALSTILMTDIDRPEPDFWEGEGNNFAIIQLPDGRMKHVRFSSIEELLSQAAKFELSMTPFKISASTSIRDGAKNLTVTVDDEGHAVVVWDHQSFIGKFDPDTKQIKIDISTGSQWTLQFEFSPTGSYFLSSLEVKSVENSMDSIHTYYFQEDGLLEAHSWNSETSFSKMAFTYVHIGDKVFLGSVIASTETVDVKEGVTLRTETFEKTFYAYDASGNEISYVTVTKSTSNGVSFYYALYNLLDGVKQYQAQSFGYFKVDLTNLINSAKDYEVVNQFANSKMEFFCDGDGGGIGKFKFSIEYAKNEKGEFVAKFVQVASTTFPSIAYIVQGLPDVLSDESNDIPYRHAQTVNGYTVSYTAAYQQLSQVFAREKLRYIGYGLVFSKPPVQPDGTWDHTVVVVDYPQEKTVALDGKFYDIEIDKDGMVQLKGPKIATIQNELKFQLGTGRVVIDKVRDPSGKETLKLRVETLNVCSASAGTACKSAYQSVMEFDIESYILSKSKPAILTVKTVDGKTLTFMPKNPAQPDSKNRFIIEEMVEIPEYGSVAKETKFTIENYKVLKQNEKFWANRTKPATTIVEAGRMLIQQTAWSYNTKGRMTREILKRYATDKSVLVLTTRYPAQGPQVSDIVISRNGKILHQFHSTLVTTNSRTWGLVTSFQFLGGSKSGLVSISRNTIAVQFRILKPMNFIMKPSSVLVAEVTN